MLLGIVTKSCLKKTILITKVIVITMCIMSVPARSFSPSFTFSIQLSLALYSTQAPCIVKFFILNMEKISPKGCPRYLTKSADFSVCPVPNPSPTRGTESNRSRASWASPYSVVVGAPKCCFIFTVVAAPRMVTLTKSLLC